MRSIRALPWPRPLAVFVTLTAVPAMALVALAHASAESPTASLAAIPRVLEPGAPLPCEGLPITRYRGTHLRYQKPLRVHEAFVSRLVAFESLVAKVAKRHYGRAPRRIVHLGGFNCRRMRTYPDWVSEHALGNAIDVAGFDFGPLPTDVDAADLPRRLRRPFSVRIERHFRARDGLTRRHAAFLHDLTRALIAHEDIFSVVLGPGWPGHHNHLHLDAAPYRVVEVDLPQGLSLHE